MLAQSLQNSVLILQTIAIALSIFNLLAFLWLACTVWLNGDRQSMIARVGVVGLGFSAFFFFINALLISGSLSQESGIVSTEFLWHLIWFPALCVPYIWFIIGLHYASLVNERWHRRRPFLLVAGAIFGLSILTILWLNQATFTFQGTLLLLTQQDVPLLRSIGPLSPLIWLPVLFLGYVTFCAIGPWFTPGRVWRLLGELWQITVRHKPFTSLRRNLVDAFWGEPINDHQEEPGLSWHLARPVVLLAALLMVCLTMSLGGMGMWVMFNWLQQSKQTLSPPLPPVPMPHGLPVNLVLLDIYATGCVSLIVLLIGYSIVRYGILVERPLGRRGFFEQWRGIVIVATLLSLFIALLVWLTRSSLGALLIITSITTGTYALFTWSSYTAHDRYVALLKPFLRSTTMRHWLNTDLLKTEQNMEALFSHLCKNVLEVRCARLVVLSGPVRRSFNYRWSMLDVPEDTSENMTTGVMERAKIQETLRQEIRPYSDGQRWSEKRAYRIRVYLAGVPVVCWVLPIYDELGLVAKLYLGPREDDGFFSNEDMNLAQACGQRMLDTLRDHDAMLAVAGLLRRRIVDVKLLGAQQRRVLHDEILPMLHLALIRLETVRSNLTGDDQATAGRSGEAVSDAIGSISDAHRQLAAMMRAMATGAPHRLERDGMMHAIHTMLEQDFQEAFDEVVWEVPEDVVLRIDELVPPAIAELIFAAVQEALRNAARHARGSDLHRRLCLTIRASCNPHLEVVVIDDGIGIVGSSSSTTGTGGGLLTHSALLAIAGGNLTVQTAPSEGVTVRIFMPFEALR